MRAAFKENGTRKQIDLAGLQDIYVRLFAVKTDGLIKADLEDAIKRFGRCECSDLNCKAPLKGDCEFDHNYPDSLADEKNKVDWRALTKACHSRKTNKQDKPHIAKVKRTAEKYNPEYAPEPDPYARPAQKIQSRGFQPAPQGHTAWGMPRAGSGFKRGYKSNDKVVD